MDEEKIVELFWNRDESAVENTNRMYGAYCRSIAMDILHDAEDAQECVNDALLRLWNTIPPQCPKNLKAFIGRITRNLSMDRARKRMAQKRGGGMVTVLAEELEMCVPSSETVERQIEGKALEQAMNSFLYALPERDRVLFLLRYFYAKSIDEAAKQCGVSEGNAKVMLHRIRKKLRKFLEQEDITL